MRLRFIRVISALATLVVVMSCGGADGLAPTMSAGPGSISHTSESTLLAGLNVSGPVAIAGISADRGAISASIAPSAGASYVSLVPGTVADGSTATIANLRTAQRVAVPIVDGGFDPQPIPASPGDTLQVTVSRMDQPEAAAYMVVAVRVAPRIVRSRPPRGQTDAPLNTIITLVFSEPLDPVSVNATSVTLTTAGSPVAGAVRLLPGTGYTVEFTPSTLLAPLTTYSLTVSGVATLAGTPLADATSIPFTTGTAVGSDTVIAFGGQATREIPVNSHFIAYGFRGPSTGASPGTLLKTTWRSRDTSIATVTPWDTTTSYGDVVGIRPGTTVIEGSALGVTTTIAVTVLAPAPASAVSPVLVGFRMPVVEAKLGPGHNHWSFGPELALTDTTGRGGSAIVGVSFDFDAPSVNPDFAGFNFANGLTCSTVGAVGPDPLVVNYETFGTLVVETSFTAQWSGEAVAHVTLRIPGPAAMRVDVRAPIVPNSAPTLGGGKPAEVLSCGW